ncbi:MAG TPA: hypothetical protein VGD56_19470, partial [Gemmatirosa sp.]
MHAFVHLARLAALDGDARALDTLTTRALAIAAEGDEAAELRGLRGVALGDRDALARSVTWLRTAPVNRTWVAAWRVATYGGNPVAATALLAPLTDAAQSASVRAAAYVARAEFVAAGGQWRRACAKLDTADARLAGSAWRVRTRLALVPLAPWRCGTAAGIASEAGAYAASPPGPRLPGAGQLDTTRVPTAYVAALVTVGVGSVGTGQADSVARLAATFEQAGRGDLAAGVWITVSVRLGQVDALSAVASSAVTRSRTASQAVTPRALAACRAACARRCQA